MGVLTSPRFLLLIIFAVAAIVWMIVKKGEKKFSTEFNSVDAIVPAYNEEVTISRTVNDLYKNKYIHKIIVVNDGSTDNTLKVLNKLKKKLGEKLEVINQVNQGKSRAINNALDYVTTDYVFLTDADIRIPNDNGIGYLIASIEQGADAVAGIPGTDLNNVNFLGKIRASIKVFFATYRKCGMEVIGGHPFCVSGSVGLYRSEVLKKVKFPSRTCVEDLDLSWELVSRGYKVSQSSRAIVYSQEAASFYDDIKRWRRWISGYAVCMRIHKNMIFTRFGLFVILPNFLVGFTGVFLMLMPFFIDFRSAYKGFLCWFILLFLASSYSAKKQGKKWWLVLYSPLSAFYIFIVTFCWIRWGIPSLVTGKEYGWSKVKRY